MAIVRYGRADVKTVTPSRYTFKLTFCPSVRYFLVLRVYRYLRISIDACFFLARRFGGVRLTC